MIPALVAICAALGIGSFFLWATIHELSHLVAAKLAADATLIEIKVWPHFHNDNFYWASIRYERHREASRAGDAFIHLAPRIPDLIGALALPLACLLPSPWFWFYTVVVGAALFDLGNGSIGYCEHADLRRAARAMQISPWWIRVVGWTIAATSAGAWALASFL